MPRLTLVAKLACLALAGGLLSGCNATVTTDISVTGPSTSSITEIVHFDGDAGKVIASSPRLQSDLESAIARRIGGAVHLDVSGSTVTWRQAISYAQLTANADVTGLSSAALAASGPDAVVTLDLVRPTALYTAITDAASMMANPQSLIVTMEQYTDVAVQVDFPGKAVIVSNPAGVRVGVTGSHAVVDQYLSSWQNGRVVVRGSLARSHWWMSPFMLGGIAVLGGLVILERWRLRRR
jgi:hypothetical protein